MKKLDPKGLGMVEMLMALLFLGVVAQSLVLARLVAVRKTVSVVDHGFASVKGQQMFNELAARVNGNPVVGGAAIDDYNDGSGYSLILTADKNVMDPADPLSGNSLADGHRRYLRQVQVDPVDYNPMARQVIIRIWRCGSDGSPLVPGLLLATTMGTVAPGIAPTYFQTPQVNMMPFGHF